MAIGSLAGNVCFQRLVKQFIQMCRRGFRTFPRFFLSEHDFGAFFAVVFLVYWMFAPAGPADLRLVAAT
jgi:hypothetical protein